MRRHRFDPLCLSKPPSHEQPGGTVLEPHSPDECWEQQQQHSGGDTEAVPSQYNVFYSRPGSGGVGSAEGAQLVSRNTEESFEPFHRPLSSVQIEEMGFASNEEAAEVDTAQSTASSTQPKAAKPPQERAGKNKASAKGKAKMKTRRQQQQPSSKAPVVSALSASVENAWSAAKQTPPVRKESELSQFFLSGGVDSTQWEEPHTDHTPIQGQSSIPSLTSTIWLPGNSIPGNTESQQQQLIILATDLPPPGGTCHSNTENPGSTSPTDNYDSHESSSGAEEEEEEEEGGVVRWQEEGRGHEEEEEEELRDLEDTEALETLAWELASTISETGRLTRCDDHCLDDDGVSDSEDDESEPLSAELPGELGVEGMRKVMSEFELYQRRLMDDEQDSS